MSRFKIRQVTVDQCCNCCYDETFDWNEMEDSDAYWDGTEGEHAMIMGVIFTIMVGTILIVALVGKVVMG